MPKKLTLIILAILSFYFAPAQSKIEKAEESLKKQDQTNGYYTETNNYDSSSSNSNSYFGEMVAELFIGLFAYTAYGVLVESPFEYNSKSHNAILTKRVYNTTNTGHYTYEWNDNSAIGRTTISTKYIFENPKLQGNHLNVDMRFFNRLALEVNYLQLWENNTNFGHDALAIYTALGKYHRVRTKAFDGWWGLGASYVDGDVNSFGFTYGLGAEIFLGKPISLESSFNQTLVNQSTVNKFNALINYYINQYKIHGGYEYLKIGNQNFSTVSLGAGFSF
ncbi:hypothetical protein PK35_03400 [Tamlana nanhaiensis]|uniref:Outer membrane protein beta-barrel domain-containing protein n=1 Tax=Neotamlana nanhaiensis TaxID=1382798 RepID=A0A0D7W3W8_9FLAO|nr:hypothetical protein [Tamlana nanhaiensis]KJD33810.1 hypothetical protein PK35_03400 [Tamlana nanhaiensis]